MGFGFPQAGFYRPSTGSSSATGTSIINAPVTGTGVDNDPTLAANSATLLATQQATKTYIDTVAQGLDPKQAVRLATAAALPAVTYANGASGVGATLTANAIGALTVDGVAVALGDRLLIQNQVAGLQNGIYSVTTLGTGAVAFVLTRTADANSPSEIEGAYVFVTAGTVNAASAFVCTTAPPITIGTTAITFTQFAGSIPSTVVLLGGRAGGQTIYGGTAASENLALNSTFHATKGQVQIASSAMVIDGSTGLVGIGQTTPAALLDIAGNKSFASWTTSGRNLRIEDNTLTDTTGSGTIAFRAINSIGVPTLIASSPITLTMSANVYIAGAPVASTNVTHTERVALFIDTGNASSKGIIVRGASSQSADIESWRKSDDTVYMAVSSSGVLKMGNSALAIPATISRDINAGDSTNPVSLAIGNSGTSQGSFFLQYVNAAAAGAPQAILSFQPRNNAGSTVINPANITVAKTAGADTASIALTVTGGSLILAANTNVGIGITAPLQKLHIFDGNIRMDQVAAAGAPTVATGAAGVLTGTYKYAVTFVTATGETDIGTISGNVSPSAQQVSVTAIPVSSDSLVTSRNLYRSTAGGATSTMKLVANIADNTTTVYTDNIADGSLTTPISYKNTTGGAILVGTSPVATWGTTFVGIGNNAGQGTGGSQSVAIGTSSMSSMTTALSNTAVGYVSMSGVTTGTGNAAFGAQAGRFNQTGSSNTWIGDSAGVGVSSNSNNSNTGVGASAGIAITTGSSNVLLGILAGSTLTTGGSNIIIGNNIQTAANSTANFLSIGNVLFGTGVGSTTGTTVSTTGKIGINIVAPAQALHIFDGNIRMDNVTGAGAPTTALNGAGVLTGTYQYAVTFVTAIGETSVIVGNIAGTSIAPSSQQVQLTAIPVSADASVTSRKIYRTPAGGDFASLKLLTTIADNTTTTFNDNTADGSLGANMPWKNTTGSNILQNVGRVFLIDTRNVSIGQTAGGGIAIGGYDSVAIGTSALALVTTGIQNVAVGMQAGQAVTIGSANTLIGRIAGGAITTASSNTAVGAAAMQNNVTGASNTMIGTAAGLGVAANSYSSNTAVGASAGTALTTGSNNILIGDNAGNTLTTGGTNIIIGHNIQTAANSTSNVLSIGNLIYGTGLGNTGTALSNGSVGINIVTPSQRLHVFDGNFRMDNVALATSAPSVATGAAGVLTGAYQYAVTFVTPFGETSVDLNAGISSVVNPSSQQVALTAIPVSADATVTSRKIYRTTAGGINRSMKLVTTIADNTTTTFNDNVADGSLTTNMPWKNSTGGIVMVNASFGVVMTPYYTGIGIGAGNITVAGGSESVAIGSNALGSLTVGYQNTVVGYAAANAITTGLGHTAIGYAALLAATTANNNVAIGSSAGRNNVTGASNVWIGNGAGLGVAANSHANNTGIGFSVGNAITTGSNNIFLGFQAGDALTTGSNNIIIGYDIDAPVGTSSNQMTIGNLIFSAGINGTGTTISTGNVGIGVAAPVQRLHVMNGNIRMDQIAQATALTAATGIAGVLTGAYFYAVTYVTATGETSIGLGLGSTVVNPSAQQVNLTNIPVSADTSVTSRKIYRTPAGGALDSAKLLTTIADNTTTIFTDNVADGSLGANAPFKNTTGGQFYLGTTRFGSIDATFTGFGVNAGGPNNTAGENSVAIGAQTMASATIASYMTVVGYAAANTITTGSAGVAMGYAAMQNITTGTGNTAIGYVAGRNNQTGTNNTWIGTLAGSGVASNSNSANTGLGYSAGTAITTGGSNVLIGDFAGSTLTTGGSNVILGHNIQTPAVGTSNFMSLGNLIFSAAVDATGTTVSSGNVGIAIAAPAAKLHISAASSAISSATWTTTGKIFATDALSLTNTTSSGTVALQVEHSFGVPTLLASSSTTITMSANVYIAGAPIASTNVTQTAKTALFIDTGAAASTALVLRAAGSPSVDIFQVQTSANALLLSVASSGNLVFADAVNIAAGTTTGTIIGTATSQKLSLWNATPNVQPTTGIVAAAFVANTSGIANDTATFGGYTIGQVVAALKRLGALA